MFAREKLPLKAIDWQTAAGLVGQLIIVIRLVLYIAIMIIFLVALVIINNSMVTATMDRVAEIGTMRAIGAQRRFVLVMFILETLVLGAVMGTLGAGLGILTMEILGSVGIPAPNQILRFLFAGPRLYPTWGAWNVGFAVVIIFLVSIISTLYPALIATRVQPVVAMRGRD
jgi:ABC-type lipoprotein release transport system permease subunit